MKWLQGGDQNSKKFHASTLERHDRNRVQRIKGQNGIWVEGQLEVEQTILDYFREVYTSERPHNFSECLNAAPRLVSQDINEELMRIVTDSEIKSAMESLGPLKSLGPDGFNGLFYQNHWSTVKEEVCKAVKEFFEGGDLPVMLNETVVTLIPKIPMPESINQLRLISCCNFSYKIISKIVVLRLKKFMDSLISPNQSTFVGGRLIQDNLIVAHEVFHALKKRRDVGGVVWQ